MSANVKSMAYVVLDGVPWWVGGSEDWGQAAELPTRVMATEILAPAGIDWTVTTLPVYTEYGRVEGAMAIVREDIRANLGMVTDAYKVIQNRELAEMLDAMSGGTPMATTAGVLCGAGERCWISLDLGDVVIQGEVEPLRLYAVAVTGHDGLHHAKVCITTVRPVCQNTLRWGLQCAKWDRNLWHTGDTAKRMAEAAEAMASFVGFGERMARAGELLMATKYTDEEFGILASVLTATDDERKWYAEWAGNLGATGWRPTTGSLLEAITEATRAGQVPTDMVPERVVETRATMSRLFHDGTGITDAMQNTAWAALQAVSEHADHVRPYGDTKKGTGTERRILSILEGEAMGTKSAAMDVIQAQAGLTEAMDSIFAVAA